MKRLLEVAGDYGVDTKLVLRRIGLDPEALEQDDTYYSLEQHIESIRAIQDQRDIEGLGLLVGRRISIADLGIIGYAMLSSLTFGKAIDVAIRFQRLTDPVLHIQHQIEGSDIVLSIEPLVLLGAAYQYDVEETLAIWQRLLESLLDGSGRIKDISVTWPKPVYSVLYHELFNCPIRFEQPKNQFRLSRDLLNRPLSLANDQAARICEQECTRLLRRIRHGETIVDSVRRVMVNIPGRFPGLDEVAERLRMSPRNLRRRLSECDTSFRQISDEVRMHLAKEYLEDTNLAVEQVAYLVGYSEAANFHRAFKRYLGSTPSEFRRNHLASPLSCGAL
jgi:AraC-like DNA-binding protein